MPDPTRPSSPLGAWTRWRTRKDARNAHGYPITLSHGHFGCTDGGDLGPCDCLCHRDRTDASDHKVVSDA